MDKPLIMVVDDEEVVRRLLEKRLASHGYDVLTVANARTMWNKLEKNYPDLIVMDIVLPDIEGPEVVQALRENQATQRIPVIFLSSIIDNSERGILPEVRVGEESFPALGKPVDIELLVQKLRFILDRAREAK